MVTAVDTSVLLDVFLADPKYGRASLAALERASQQGTLIGCETVWAETAAAFESDEAAGAALEAAGVDFRPSSQPAALKAGNSWREYRRSGGKRERVIADFLVGAHALESADRLLTRDRGFQRTYFRELVVVEP